MYPTLSLRYEKLPMTIVRLQKFAQQPALFVSNQAGSRPFHGLLKWAQNLNDKMRALRAVKSDFCHGDNDMSEQCEQLEVMLPPLLRISYLSYPCAAQEPSSA